MKEESNSCRFAIYSTPVGYVRVEHREERLTLLHILEEEPIDFGYKDSFTELVYSQVIEYLSCKREAFDIELDFSGCTPFQIEVLEELQKIPYGVTKSYKDIAVAIGRPKASRAVGMANNRNPIHIIIPCHRVVGSHGDLRGYAAGVDVKEFLLNLEMISKSL